MGVGRMKRLFLFIFILVSSQYLGCDDNFNKSFVLLNLEERAIHYEVIKIIEDEINKYILDHPYYIDNPINIYIDVPVYINVPIYIDVPMKLDEDNFRGSAEVFLYNEKVSYLREFILLYRKDNGAVVIPANEVDDLLTSLEITYEFLEGDQKEWFRQRANLIIEMVYQNQIFP